MKRIITTSIAMLAIFTLLTGILYPFFIRLVAIAAFPRQADGSLIKRDGAVIGSSLIAQKFGGPEYFHPRPSAVDYDASNSGGSNLAPSNPDLLAGFLKRLDEDKKANPDSAARVPDDMLTASGSGLDPDITREAAIWQVPRVAKARKADEKKVIAAINKLTKKPLLGFIGTRRINVLELNIYLDDNVK